MYRVDITKVTKLTQNNVTTKVITEATATAFRLDEGYAKMLQAFNEGYEKGCLTNATTGEVHMTFTREDSASGTNLNQWLSNTLMNYMAVGASICCIPEDKVQTYLEEEEIWEEDYYDEEEVDEWEEEANIVFHFKSVKHY